MLIIALAAPLASAALSKFLKFFTQETKPSLIAPSSVCTNFTSISYPYVAAYPDINKIVVSSLPSDVPITDAAAFSCPVLQFTDYHLSCLSLDPCAIVTTAQTPSSVHPLSFTILGVLLAALVFSRARSRPSAASDPGDPDDWVAVTDDAVYLEEVLQFCALHRHFKSQLIARL